MPRGRRCDRSATSPQRTPTRAGTRAPVGLGLDSADVRARMVERLRADGISDARVLAAFAAVPRHLFVDAALATQAYEDTSLPIGHGQTISKPSVVARMLELLFAGANARGAGDLGAVLEIGTGCGYQAALLCRLGTRVVSVERLQAAARQGARAARADARSTACAWCSATACAAIRRARRTTASSPRPAAATIPQAWLDQLAVGGRLVSPVQQRRGGQVLVVVDRHADGYTHSVHEAVKFVPLKSGLAG